MGNLGWGKQLRKPKVWDSKKRLLIQQPKIQVKSTKIIPLWIAPPKNYSKGK